MSLPSYYTPGHYKVVAAQGDGVKVYAIAAPGGQLVGRPDTYETRDAAKARASRLNDTRAAMAPKGTR